MMRKGMMMVAVLLVLGACGGGGHNGEDVGRQPGGDDLEAPGELSAELPGAEAGDGVAPRDEPPCLPACDGRDCGDDGCGGSCGDCSGPQESCKAGRCVCSPTCAGKECGEDGCGGSCGQCEPPNQCQGNQCECTPDCEGRECGYDGCLGSCGSCPDGYTCDHGICDCAYGHCAADDDLAVVCSGGSLGNCGYWQCAADGCCQIAQIPPPDCCQKSSDCRDCFLPATGETVACPVEIPEGAILQLCTKDSCGLNNQCKHFDKTVLGECNDANPCTADSCAPATGFCSHTPVPGCQGE